MSKQEPVAWQWLDTANFRKKLSESANKDEWTPLYTAPQTKPLSDEEIENIWHELYPLDSNNYWEDNRKGLCQLRFARAILKKASEK